MLVDHQPAQRAQPGAGHADCPQRGVERATGDGLLEPFRVQLELLGEVERRAAAPPGTREHHVLDERVGAGRGGDAIVEDEVGHVPGLRTHLLPRAPAGRGARRRTDAPPGSPGSRPARSSRPEPRAAPGGRRAPSPRTARGRASARPRPTRAAGRRPSPAARPAREGRWPPDSARPISASSAMNPPQASSTRPAMVGEPRRSGLTPTPVTPPSSWRS